MSYYHTFITRKRNAQYSQLSIFSTDLSSEELEKSITKPYQSGKKFLCDGATIDPQDVERIKIYQTDQTFQQLEPMIKEKRNQDRVILLLPYEHDLTQYGRDVTSYFITSPPKDTSPKTVNLDESKSGTKNYYFNNSTMQQAGDFSQQTAIIPKEPESKSVEDDHWKGYATGVVGCAVGAVLFLMARENWPSTATNILIIFGVVFLALGVGSFWKPLTIGKVLTELISKK